MPINDVAIRKAKPGIKPNGDTTTKPYKMADGGGMYLEVMPNGSKYWRLKYRVDGKEKRLALGVYPDISLAEARQRRDDARKLLANGVDPGEVKQQAKKTRREVVANSFEAIAREWLAKHKHTWADSHSEKILYRLEKDVFPWMGSRPIAEIKAPELLAVLRRTESRGALDTVKRIKQNCGQVFRYAVATGRAERDPSQDLRGAIAPAKLNHFAAITNPIQAGELLRAIDGFKGTFVVQCALRLAPLVFVRPGELRKAQWEDINLDKAEWRYYVTKTKTQHSVPLATQAIEILRDLHSLTGHGQYVFPGRDPKKPMSEAAVNAALRRMGYDTKTEITGHGFRAMARTILAEELHQKPEVIEHQLAHKVPDILGTAYNRTKFIKERKEMMQLWADYLGELKVGAKVLEFKEA